MDLIQLGSYVCKMSLHDAFQSGMLLNYTSVRLCFCMTESEITRSIHAISSSLQAMLN